MIQVSGGNTLFAVRRWRNLGLDKLLHEAMARGCVLAGGSAGAICWFDGGHSDSLAPSTVHPDSRRELTAEQRLAWSYCRVKGLGFVDAFCCPHHDQHEGHASVSRAEHFDGLLRMCPGEVGLGIDNDACLVVEGDSWRGAWAMPPTVHPPPRPAAAAHSRLPPLATAALRAAPHHVAHPRPARVAHSLALALRRSREQRVRRGRWEGPQEGV